MTKVVFETATIADAIKKAERVAPSKGSAFDKAAGIVLQVYTGLPVVIKATNLDIYMMQWVDSIECDGAAEWRVPSQLFAAVVGSLPIGSGKTVTLEEKAGVLHLTSGRTKARFNLMMTEYYPTWEAFDPDEMTQANDLGGRVAQVEWAASKSEIPISGVHFDGEQVIATDRYRIAKAPLHIEGLKEPITVPAGLLGGVLKQTGEVSVSVDGNMLLVMPDEYTQIKTVIYGESYPKVANVMDKGRGLSDSITFRKTSVLEIMQRATNFAGGDRIAMLRVFFGQGEIAVMMTNDEVGLLGDVVEVPGYADHERVEFRFTPKNIMEAISKAPNEEVTLSYDKSRTGFLVHLDGGSGYESWVMPRVGPEPQE